MLQRILEMLRSGDGTLTLSEIARALDAPVSAIEPMVALLVRTGMLGSAPRPAAVACAGSCGGSCDPAACPFLVMLPAPVAIRRR